MTKAKALYQAKLILDCIPEEEYKLIPQDTIDYIEQNMEYDENIKISEDIPLEKQRIDDKTYEILEDIMKKIDSKSVKKQNETIEIKEIDEIQVLKSENMKLKQIIENNKINLEKFDKTIELLKEYKDALKVKDDEIKKLNDYNKELCSKIYKLPKLIRKIFFKEFDDKLLKK